MGRSGRRTAGVILAAGGSHRFEGQPKALLDIDGAPAVARLVERLHEAGVGDVGVVLGGHAERVIGSLPPGTQALVNPEWERGRTGSVQAGLRWAQAYDAVVLWPVDHPFVRTATVERLLAAADDPLALWTLPEHSGRGGHPVVVASGAFGTVAELGADTPLRALLPRLGVQVKRVPVDDPAVRWNTDTPETYDAARAAWLAQGGDRWTGG